ncbi:hypothetical protein OPQ81_007203 [Rhizoctonia solani]|nr:hypothetical protein OPQ81_007203 [Rhizoctonia solani]
MKVTGIISALVFAHAALGQAADSTSATASTLSVSGARSATSASPAASASSSAHGSQSRTRTSSSTASDPTPTGSTGSIGSLTESHTGDSNPPHSSGDQRQLLYIPQHAQLGYNRSELPDPS